MRRFRDLSIKKKLVFISMLSSVAALLFTLSIFFIGALFATSSSTQERIASLARVVGTNCVAALAFEDPEAAKETLKALSAEPQIVSATIYKADKTLFAEYQRDPRKPKTGAMDDIADEKPAGNGTGQVFKYRFAGGQLHVRAEIELDHKVIGSVELSSDLKELYHRALLIALIGLIVLIFSFLLALALSSMAQRTISGPITTLTHTMNQVSEQKDYTLRVQPAGHDDIGMLIDGFNTMLAEIQARDEKLYFTQFSVDHMADAAYWMDVQSRIVNANHAACDALGVSREKLLAMSFSDIDPSFGQERWHEIWQNACARKTVAFESSHLRSDGKLFPVEVYANILQFQDQQYLCAFARNIAERKKLQLQLEQAQKMEAIGTLASGVAHDLNNILGGLVGYPDLLLQELPEDSPLRRRVMLVKKSGEKAAAIVQDMLTLARRGVELRNAVNLNEIVAEYLKSPEHERIMAYHPQVYFEISLAEDLPNILGSDVHLSKALMNLVSNAAEAIAESGKVKVQTRSCHVQNPLKGFQTIAPGHYAVLRVEDDGIGLSDEDLVNLFEPFYTKKKMGRSGTGLGMSVVSGAVKDHKGYIDLHSIRGKGTSFDLYFPVTHQMVQAKNSDFVFEANMGTEKILVVDDVLEQREVACVVLGKLGYQVAAVASGEEAIGYVRRNPVDLLVLDMIMDPGMDGLETYQQILKIRPGQRAVVASGYAETDRVKQIMALGVNGFVRKPYSIERLATAVKSALKKEPGDSGTMVLV